MTSWVFDLPLNPVPLERAKTGKGHGYLPAASVEFRESFQRWLLTIRPRPPAPLDMPLAVTMRFWRTTNRGQRGDLTNLVKAVEDAGNGVLWVDDEQIVDGRNKIVDAGPNVQGRIFLHVRATSDALDQAHANAFALSLHRLRSLTVLSQREPAHQAHLDQVGTALNNWLARAGLEYSDPLVQCTVLRLLDGLIEARMREPQSADFTSLLATGAAALIAATLDVVPQ